MKLLDTIINELVNVEISLSSPLLKTKILASRLQNKELLEWVNNELKGYSDLNIIPYYRRTKGEIIADYIKGNWDVKAQVLNFPNFDDQTTDRLYTLLFGQSIQALENYDLKGNNYLLEILPDNQRIVIQDYLQDSNIDLKFIKIYRRVPCNFIIEILSNVRDRLLEFMLQLEQEFGVEADISILANNNSVINQIMNTTINNSGDGAIINTGDNNKVEATINISKGNKEVLKDFLLSEKLPSTDVDELLKIVDNTTPVSKENFGEPVNSWMHKMLGKALDGSWQIGIGTAGNILAQALQNYYGI